MGEGSGLRECRGGSLSPAWRMGRVGGLGGFGKDSPAGGVSDGLGHLTRSKRQRAWTRKLTVPGSKARPPLLCEAVFMSQGTANGRGSEGGAARRLRGQGTPPPFLVPLSDACTGAQGPAPPGPPATGSAGWGGGGAEVVLALSPAWSPSPSPPRDPSIPLQSRGCPRLSEASRDPVPRPLSSRLASTPPRREWERRSQDRVGGGGGAPDARGAAKRKVRRVERGSGQRVLPSRRVAVRGPRGPGRPRAAEAGRAPRQAGIGAGRAASPRGEPVTRSRRRHQSFPEEPRTPFLPRPRPRGRPSGENCFRGRRAPSPARPRASIAPNSDSQLGRRRGPAHARLPRRRRLLLLLPPGSRLRAEPRAETRPPRAALRLAVRRPRPCGRRPAARCALARGPAERGPPAAARGGPGPALPSTAASLGVALVCGVGERPGGGPWRRTGGRLWRPSRR